MDRSFLHLFVYGTLKKGFPGHERLCHNILKIIPASVKGRLYLLPEGYPTLVVPQEIILALGTENLGKDAALAGYGGMLNPENPKKPTCGREWHDVTGELLVLGEQMESLRAIDVYEDFCPRGESLYHRVLVPVDTAWGRKVAWTYVVAEDSRKRQLGRARPISRWPA